MSSLNLQRSKRKLEEEGYSVWIVEKFNQWSHTRQDLYYFGDLVAIREDQKGVLAIQSCGEDVQDHVRKVLEGYVVQSGKKAGTVIGPNTYLPIWLKAGNPFFIWAWRLRGAKGKRKTYELKVIEFLLENGQVVNREIP